MNKDFKPHPHPNSFYWAHQCSWTLSSSNNMQVGRLNSWVVSHLALIIGTLHHALGCEFNPWWWQTQFQTQAQHLCFLHDSIWFIWFDTIIRLSNLSCELWNRKLKIQEIYFKKTTCRSPAYSLTTTTGSNQAQCKV